MDDYVIRAMAKWPNVPAVYGWLSLDRRGDWRIKGERLGHRKAVAFINRNYAADETGCWYFQNGPQRVYVRLDYTPMVYRLDASGALAAHTGELVESVERVLLDDEGNLLLETPEAVGVVDDRDLEALSGRLRLEDGTRDQERVAAAVDGIQSERSSNLVLAWKRDRIPVRFVRRDQVSALFGFNPHPDSDAEEW